MNSKLIEALYWLHTSFLKLYGKPTVERYEINLHLESQYWGEAIPVRSVALLQSAGRRNFFIFCGSLLAANAGIVFLALKSEAELRTVFWVIALFTPGIITCVVLWVLFVYISASASPVLFFRRTASDADRAVKKLWRTVPVSTFLRIKAEPIISNPVSVRDAMLEAVMQGLKKEDESVVETFNTLITELEGKTIGEVLEIARTI